MNVSTYSCSDDTLGCSCGDCPSAGACSSTAAPPTQKRHACSIKIGSLEVNMNFCIYLLMRCNINKVLLNKCFLVGLV